LTSSQISRTLGVAGFLTRSAVKPSSSGDVFRALGGHALDLEFEAASPFPELPDTFFGPASDDFVLLPPAHLLLPGNQSLAGLMSLVALARSVSARRIFEIGTYNGLTATTLAANLPAARIETLDLPPGSPPALTIAEADHFHTISFENRVYEGTPHEVRIVQHFGDSAEFDFGTLGDPFDLVYVDGAHSRAYVENDTRAAFSIVDSSGIVVWDDYWRLVPDVASFLHTLPDQGLYRVAGTRLVVRPGAG
jgi:hypothetical protein